MIHVALSVWLMGLVRFDPESYCAPDPFRRRIVPSGVLLIRRVLSLTRGTRATLPSTATWVDRAVHPFASFGALTALFNSSNSETILIIFPFFITYLRSLFLHPSSLHPFFLTKGCSSTRSTLAFPAVPTPLKPLILLKNVFSCCFVQGQYQGFVPLGFE